MTSILEHNLRQLYVGLHDPTANEQFLPLVVVNQHLFHKRAWKGLYYPIEIVSEAVYGSFTRMIHEYKDQGVGSYYKSAFQRYHRVMGGWKRTIEPAKEDSPSWWLKPFKSLHQHYFGQVSLLEEAIGQGIESERALSHIKVDLIMKETFLLFDQCVSDSIKGYDQYKSYWLHLLGKTDATLLSEERMIEIRQQIIACSEATLPFWKFFLKGDKECPHPQQLLKRFDVTSLTNSTTYYALKSMCKVINLEGLLEQDIPIVELAQLGTNKNLSDAQSKSLKKWMKALNRSTMSISKLMSALEAISEVIKMAHPTFSLDQLILRLDEHNGNFFKQADFKHIKWREQLKAGDQVACNGVSYTLGSEIGDKISSNEYRLFNISEDTVMRIADNRVKLKLQAKKSNEDKWHWGVHLAEHAQNGLDKNGKCEIIEKLHLPQWKSTSYAVQDDRERLLAIASHLFYMQDQLSTPQGWKAESLMFGVDGEFKSTRLMPKGDFDYNALEAFCISTAKGNTHVVNYLMHVSQLAKNPVANFYREAVEYVFCHQQSGLIGIVLDRQYRRDIYNVHADKLCQKAIALISDCACFVRDHLLRAGKFTFDSENEFKKEICSRLLVLYKSSATPGTLATDQMKQDILDSFLTKKECEKIPDDFYKKEFTELQKRNEEALKEVD